MNLATLYENDLDKLITEISLFKDEAAIWTIKEGIINSAGNLALHLVGNLNHFVGKTLGNSGYERKRDDEFSLKNIPRHKLISDVNDLKETIKNVIPSLSPEDLEKDFPLMIRDQVLSTQMMLIYLLAHFNYHLGQINYLRRMM